MAGTMFEFIAVRAPRPVGLDHWRQVRTRLPDSPQAGPGGGRDVDSPRSARQRGSTAARRRDTPVLRLLEDLSAWMVQAADARSVAAIRTWIAGRRAGQVTYRNLAALLATDEWVEARGILAERSRSTGTDEPAVRLLLLCGLLERVLDAPRRFATAADVASWLSTAMVVDDGAPEPATTGTSATEPRSLLELPPEPADGRWQPYRALARTPLIGDVVVVEQELCGYEHGEVADIENILAGELKDRRDRDLEITQTESVEETERTRTDVESTEQRDETKMSAESQNTLERDTRFEANLNVEAQYPPYLKVTADAGISMDTTTARSDRSATEAVREVVAKTSRTVAQREMRRWSTMTRRERERRFRHQFKAGTANVVGVYRHVDAVWIARTVRHGRRLMCEFLIPEPSLALKRMLTERPPVTIDRDPPPALETGPADITRDSWEELVARHGAGGVTPPPDEIKVVSRAFKGAKTGEGDIWAAYRFEAFDSITVPDGYEATGYRFAATGRVEPRTDYWPLPFNSRPRFEVTVAGYVPISTAPAGTVAVAHYSDVLDHLVDVVPFSVVLYAGFGFAGTMSVECVPTAETMDRWRVGVYARLLAAHQAAVADYEARLDEARRLAGGPTAALRSGETRGLIARELRRLCLTMLENGALPRPPGTALFAEEEWGVPDHATNVAERERILFFEQAFDWGLLQYVPYSYLWADKGRWAQRATVDDPDAWLAEFERAGALRVVVPARKEFDAALLWYLRRGEVWFGGNAPQDYADPLYVSIALEIAEQRQKPRRGKVLDEFRFRLPTPHVVLGELPLCPEPDLEPESESESESEPEPEPEPEPAAPRRRTAARRPGASA